MNIFSHSVNPLCGKENIMKVYYDKDADLSYPQG